MTTLPTRRDLLSAAFALPASALLKELHFAQGASAPAAATRGADPLAYVHPEFRPALAPLVKLLASSPPLSAATLANQRQQMKGFARPVLPTPTITEHTVPGSSGAPPVRVFIAGNSSGASKPAVLHIHGGGYVVGSAEMSRRDIQELSNVHECVAVSVDYRLAPETRFPGSLEDNYAALRWMHTNAAELGIDVKRIAIKGESAGGGHAAALAIAARDRGELPICLQVLIYPMLDDRTGSSRQLPEPFGQWIWTAADNRFGWTSLLGVPAGSQTVPANAVPARVANLAGLPPAFIGTGSIDLFAPEDLDYAQRLMAAGVPTELSVVPGAFHGFDFIAPDATLTRQFTQAWQEALRRAFA
jgi:acetyl esterase/lipase